jgi:hypothetical protein
MQPLLGAHGIDLVAGDAVGQYRIDVERGTDRLRGSGAVAGDERSSAAFAGVRDTKAITPAISSSLFFTFILRP